jgi:hypothetical protein
MEFYWVSLPGEFRIKLGTFYESTADFGNSDTLGFEAFPPSSWPLLMRNFFSCGKMNGVLSLILYTHIYQLNKPALPNVPLIPLMPLCQTIV